MAAVMVAEVHYKYKLKAAFGDNQNGIDLHARGDGKLFNIAHLSSTRNR